jgi:hypothetical protein
MNIGITQAFYPPCPLHESLHRWIEPEYGGQAQFPSRTESEVPSFTAAKAGSQNVSLCEYQYNRGANGH